MRPFLLLLVSLAAAPALAQSSSPPAADTARLAAQPPVATDTVAALHRLFAAKRQLRTLASVGLLTAGAVGFALAATPALIPPRPGSSVTGGLYISTGNIIGVTFIVLSVLTLVGELLYLHRYSRQNEAEAVAAYQAHQLPENWRRKLKPKYFRLKQ